MNYQEVLQMVKAQNPDKSHKECQALAKKIYASYKTGVESLALAKQSGNIPLRVVGKGNIPIEELTDVENRIRAGGWDVNKIIFLGREIMHDGELVNQGKAENGINTNVTFEDNHGNILPVNGFFQVFI